MYFEKKQVLPSLCRPKTPLHFRHQQGQTQRDALFESIIIIQKSTTELKRVEHKETVNIEEKH